jgi:hypothetical protein
MPEVKSVAVIVSNPTHPGDPGRATIGYYVLEGDVLTMTDGDGVPVRRRHGGDVYKHTLQDGEDPAVIAKRLTLSIYRMARGDDLGGFNRRLTYSNNGFV